MATDTSITRGAFQVILFPPIWWVLAAAPFKTVRQRSGAIKGEYARVASADLVSRDSECYIVGFTLGRDDLVGRYLTAGERIKPTRRVYLPKAD
jgi:hypothetical protein